MARGRIYNKIYTDEEWELVNPINKEIVEDYLEEYRQRKMKPSTIKQYNNDLRIILIFILKYLKNESLLNLSKKDFRKMSLWFSEDLQMSNARVNRLMSSIRSLLTYVEDEDDYDYVNNMAKKVKGLPKEPVRTNEDNFFLTFEQIYKVRNELIKRDELQLAVLWMLTFDSSARRNEVFQVKKEGLLDGNKTNPVVGKRGKVFPLVYLNDTRELIKDYLEQRGEDDIESLWIFGQGETKRPATYESLYDRFVYISKILSEIEDKEYHIFPHSLRHSRGECLIMGDDPRIIDKTTGKPKIFSLQEIQVLMRHSSADTTSGYLKDHSEDIINDMFDFE